MRTLLASAALLLLGIFVGGCEHDHYYGDGGYSYYEAYPAPQYYYYPPAGYPYGYSSHEYFEHHRDWDADRYQHAREGGAAHEEHEEHERGGR